jgi:hypothetical protein
MNTQELEIATYRGKPIKELTRDELITALNEQARYYESRLNGKNQLVGLYKSCLYPPY